MAAHVTGNLVVLAANIAEGLKASNLLKIVLLPVFFCAVMALTATHDRFCNAPIEVSLLIRLKAVLIAGSGVLGIWATLAGWTLDFWISLLLVTLVVCGVAVQNCKPSAQSVDWTGNNGHDRQNLPVLHRLDAPSC